MDEESGAWQEFTHKFSGSMLLAVGQAQDAEAYLELTSQLGLTRSQLDSVLRQVETACLPHLLQLFDLFRAHLADTEASQHWKDAAFASETPTAHTQDIEDSTQAHTQDTESTQVQHSEDSTSAHVAGAPEELSGGVVEEQADTPDGLERNSHPRGRQAFTKAWAEVFGTSQQAAGKPAGGTLFQCPSCFVLFPHLAQLMKHLAQDHKSTIGAFSQQPHMRKKDSLYKEHGYAGKDDSDTPSQSTVKTNLSDKQMAGSNTQTPGQRLTLQGQSLLSDATEDNQTFTCGMCSRVFPSLSTMAHHMTVSHPKANVKKYLQCGLCGWKSMTGRVSLRKHIMSMHSSYAGQICGYCGKVFQSRYRCVNHMLRQCPSRQADKSKFKNCNICMARFATRRGLRSHLKTCIKRGVALLPQFDDSVLPRQENRGCTRGITGEACDDQEDSLTLERNGWPPGGLKETDEASALDVEEAEDDMRRQVKRGRPPGSKTKNKARKRPRVDEEDSVSRGEEAVWEAEDVGEESSNGMEGQAVSPRSSAIDNEEGEKQQFTCQMCGKVFDVMSAMQSHIQRKHHDNKHLLCRWCGKLFEDASQCREHVRKHVAENREKNKKAKEKAGRGVLQCGLCKLYFKQLEHFRNHRVSQHFKERHRLCSTCGRLFTSSQEQNAHKEGSCLGTMASAGKSNKKSRGPGTGSCGLCGKGFKGDWGLESHIRKKHPEDKGLLCRYCGQLFASEDMCYHHTKQHLKERKAGYFNKEANLACGMCARMFSLPSKLSAHIAQSHANQAGQICPDCGALFASPEECEDHRNTSHVVSKSGKPSQRETRKKCGLCGNMVSSRKTLLNHIKSIHSKEQDHMCACCGKYFPNVEDCLKHKEETKISASHACQYCRRVFRTEFLLESHMKRHLNQRDYQCDICGNCYFDQSALSWHMRTHTTGQGRHARLQCPQCDKTMSTKFRLMLHLRVHNNDRPFTCDLCNKGFTHATALRLHRDTHTDEKPYACEICGKRSRTKADHSRHMPVHNDRKDFVCNICGKAYRFQSGLFSHKNTHTGDRPYVCHVCGRAFKQSQSLRKHVKSHESPTATPDASIKTEDPATQHAGGAFHHSFQVDYHHPSSSSIAQPDMSKPEWAW